MSHISMGHVIHMNESCHTYTAACAHCVTHMKESCHTYEGVVAQPMNEFDNESCCTDGSMCTLCHTYEGVMAHISMSHSTHVNESCHTYGGTFAGTLGFFAGM